MGFNNHKLSHKTLEHRALDHLHSPVYAHLALLPLLLTLLRSPFHAPSLVNQHRLCSTLPDLVVFYPPL